MLQALHRAAAAYARAGMDVVVDDMLLDDAVLVDWRKALDGLPLLVVRLTAPLEHLLQRESDRILHPTPGLVAGHYDQHERTPADLIIDTSATAPEAGARLILQTLTS